MFDNIAPRYDLLNRILSFGVDIYWRKQAIKKLKKYRPQYILDVACGTGDFSFAALEAGPEHITGLDIAEEMLQIGKRKAAERNVTDKISFVKGDSEALQFADASFEAVTVAFGVRNFEDLDKGLKEINRVLKPGYPIVVLEFSRPQHFPVKQLYRFYFKTICPLIGRLISRDSRAYSYLYESVSVFPEGQDFLQHLQNAGFKNSQCRRMTFGICSLYTAEK